MELPAISVTSTHRAARLAVLFVRAAVLKNLPLVAELLLQRRLVYHETVVEQALHLRAHNDVKEPLRLLLMGGRCGKPNQNRRLESALTHPVKELHVHILKPLAVF